jgi:L-fuculose-phosphate aldolase
MSDMTVSANLRGRIVAVCRDMNRQGLNQGTAGNLSARLPGARCLITPSGLAYDAMTPDDIAVLGFDGRWSGPRRPSSEWRFHRDILVARDEAGAVLHTHSRHATAVACLGEDLKAFHYMIAVAGGDTIRCAPYRTFATQALSDVALAALDGRKACLLAHHGLIVVESSPERALALAIEVEALCATYLLARAAGQPGVLDAGQMEEVIGLFRSYGTPTFPDRDLVRVDAAALPEDADR